MKQEQSSLIMGYWEYASLENLHKRSRLWLSEIGFWKTEIRFMKNLIKRNFIHFVALERIGHTQQLHKEIRHLNRELNTMDSNVLEHETHLANLLRSHSGRLEKEYREEHRELELTVENFLDGFKTVKQDLFQLADEILKAEKMKHLLGPVNKEL